MDYNDVNNKRKYYSDKTNEIYINEKKSNSITDTHKKLYNENNEIFKIYNKVTPNNNDTLRIMTWNVHFWTNINEESSVDFIMDNIKTINPDILGIQEATFGKTKFTNENDKSRYFRYTRSNIW
jgi:hypothetical protein